MIILTIFLGLVLGIHNVLSNELAETIQKTDSSKTIITYEPKRTNPFAKKEIWEVTLEGFDEIPEIEFEVEEPNKPQKNISPKNTRNNINHADHQIITKMNVPSKNKTNLFELPKNFFFNNKYSLLAATTFSLYCLTWWHISRLSKAVYFKNSWSCWKDEIPLEILYDKQQDEVQSALITMINETYKTKEKNLSDPLLIFKKDIHYEMEYLQHFIDYYRFLKRTFLSYIFPSYEKAFKRAQEKIDRLMYLEELIEDTMHEKYMI